MDGGVLAASVTQVMTGRAAPSSPVVMVAVVLDGHGAVRGPHPAHARSMRITLLHLGPFRLFGPLLVLIWAFFEAFLGLFFTPLRPPQSLQYHTFS